MRACRRLSGAIVACAWALPAAAGADSGFPRSSIGFLGPADRVWSASVELPACSRRPPAPAPRLSPHNRLASQERRGEVIARFAGPGPVAAATLSQARRCAASAGEEATPLLVLTGGLPGFSRFQRAFSACMAKTDQPAAVGAMTLWVDNSCDW